MRALEAEIDAFVNCRKHGKEEQVVAKRDNETGEEKAKHRKHVKEQMTAKRANETANSKRKPNVEKMTKSLK